MAGDEWIDDERIDLTRTNPVGQICDHWLDHGAPTGHIPDVGG
jgi:hypothetical protein